MVNETSIKAHLFVSGPPRTGTTLLELVLSSHPAITITPETRFIDKLLTRGFARSNRQLSQEELKSILDIMRTDEKFNNWPGFNVDSYFKELAKLQEISFRTILDTLFLMYANCKGSGTLIIGNKKGIYVEGYGIYFKRVFPDSKFIFTVRDPRDTVRSILKNLSGFSLRTASAVCARRGHYISNMRKRYPNDCMVVRYEDLVQCGEEKCIEICRFLAIPFRESMVKFYQYNLNSERLLKNRKEIHKNTTTPFNPNLIGQWRKNGELTQSEVEIIEAINGKFMKEYGYERSTNSRRISHLLNLCEFWGRFWLRHLRLRINGRRYV